MIVALEDWQPRCRVQQLKAGEVHLWRAHLETTATLHASLSSAECLRAERYHFPIDRDRFIAGRGILRNILGLYLDEAPTDVRITAGLHGKPQLAGDSTLRFNLSHSDGLMLVAVTHGREVGVDLELMRDNVPFETLADHYFDPEEAWDLRLLPVSQRAWKFYDTWTSIEAQLKASGTGLANGPTVVARDCWAMLKFTPAAGYTAAVAVESGEFDFRCWSWQN